MARALPHGMTRNIRLFILAHLALVMLASVASP